MQSVMCAGESITPSKIVCVGRNYVEHIEELNNEIPTQMVLFTKPNSAISNTLMSVHQEPLHYEAELCFLVRQGRFYAVGVGLDLTKRQLQSVLKKKGLPWERAKSFDGSALFSDFVPLGNEINELAFSLEVNGRARQRGDVGLMIHKPETIYREISEFMRLENGDIVMTGTPKGVGLICAEERYALSLYQGAKLLLEQTWLAI